MHFNRIFLKNFSLSQFSLSKFSLCFFLCFAPLTLATAAESTSPVTHFIQSTNAIWIVLTGALVFLMQAGFAMLETGMARAKNAVNVMMKNYMDLCVGSLLFWAVGYGIMFGTNPTGFYGTDHFALSNASDWDYTLLFFQIMFASTAATIVSGAMAERTNYFGYLLGAMGISGIIYPLFGSWAWGEQGWLKQLGFIDFAGSTVVHSVGGWCALAGIIILGPRLGRFASTGQTHMIPGHNLTMIGLGGFLLWFGWFGFNGGSTLSVQGNIGEILINTHLAGTSGAMGALLAGLILRKTALMTDAVNGSIAGLVSITAGCATMDVHYAVLTGVIGGALSVAGVLWLERLRLDDVVGAVSVHGFCGAWGTLAAGVFLKGNLFNGSVIAVQLLGIVVAFFWVFISAFMLYWFISRTFGLRVSPLHEQRGLDITEHGEVGYPEFNKDSVYHTEDISALNKI